MKPQKSKYPWGCSLTALAVAIDETQDSLVAAIRHDGSEVTAPELADPFRRAGFHWHELMRAALALGWAIVPFEAEPVAARRDDHAIALWPKSEAKRRFTALLARFSGVVQGTTETGFGHAVAWDCRTQLFYDSNGPRALTEAPLDCRAFFVCVPYGQVDRSQ